MSGPMRDPGTERTYGDEELHTEDDVFSEDEYEFFHLRSPLDIEALQRIAKRIREL